MLRETGKQRSQRIQIDYYRRCSGLDRLRTLCIVAGLGAAGFYAMYVLASGGGSHTSTGPVARAHAAFENDCQACHEDFVPIDSQAVKIDFELAGIKSETSIAHLESTCQECHPVGHHYRESMKPQGQLEDRNCGSCHAEHRGRDNDLTHVSNQQCVTCHADLGTVCAAAPKMRVSVTEFTSESHGDFDSLQVADPGIIKFDHAQHMLAGQVDEGQKGAMTLGMLDPSMRSRYRRTGQDDASPVQLDCASCHEFAGNPSGVDSLVFDDELGRYMAPISFERHCAACHSMNPGVATDETTPLPHAAAWSKIDLLLSASIQGARASSSARIPRDDRQRTPAPGDGTGDPPSIDTVELDAKFDALRKLVEAQCLKCHDAQSITEEAIAAAPDQPPMIPPRWFQHGLYDHGVHRKIDCKYCHQAAYPGNNPAGPPRDAEVVMIGGIETCTGCHRAADLPTPASISRPEVADLLGGQTTWASDGCILCHRYHTRRNPNTRVTASTEVEVKP